MAAGGGFKGLTQNVFYNKLHIINHMSIRSLLKTCVYVCACTFLIVSENVEKCVHVCVSGNH